MEVGQKISAEEVLAEVRIILQVPEGESIIEYCKKTVAKVGEIAKDMKELRQIMEAKNA